VLAKPPKKPRLIAEKYRDWLTSSVITSLWNAPDDKELADKFPEIITLIMMAKFYRNLQTEMNKSPGMREAKLSLIKKYPHPYCWSSFILIGAAN
jgi:CHAT domain-containing protein